MNNNIEENQDLRLRDLLRQARPQSTMPPRFAQEVWRRIEVAELRAASPGWLEVFMAKLLKPARIAVAAATLLVLGGVAGVLDASMTARETAKHRYVATVAPEMGR